MLNDLIKNRVGFGCVKLSVMPTLKSALTILEIAFDNGINHFDTAPVYGSGYSEKIIGTFSKNKRDKIFIATKVGLKAAKEYNLSPLMALPLNYLKNTMKKKKQASSKEAVTLKYRRLTKEYVKSSFNSSLKNLQTDYIDYYLLHESLPSFLDESALDYLIELKNKGLVSKIGVAAPAINYLKGDISNLWDILQYEYSPDPSSKLQNIYSAKQHILHSLFVNAKAPPAVPKNEVYGYLLAKCLKSEVANKVLFSTAKKNNLLENLRALNVHFNE